MTTPSMADLPVPTRLKLLREALAPPASATTTSLSAHPDIQARLKKLAGQIAEAQQHALVREQPFVSAVPLVGPLIVRLRYAWNWMSTKWWVLPMLAQQNRFNQDIVQLLQEQMSLDRQLIDALSEANSIQQAEIARLHEEIKLLWDALNQAHPDPHSQLETTSQQQ